MSPIRILCGLMAAVPLGVLVVLSFLFGRDVLGDGSSYGHLYGVLLGAFGIIGAIGAFSASEAWRERQMGRLVAAIAIVAVSVACSALASTLTLGARQAALLMTAERGNEAADRLRSLKLQLTAVPAHRPVATIAQEIKIRTEAARSNPRSEPFPVSQRVALNTEMGHALRADELRSQIAISSQTQPIARPAAAIEWLADQVQRPVQSVGIATMMMFIVAGEIIGAFGLFAVWGSHGGPTGGQRLPAPVEEVGVPAPTQPVKVDNVIPLRPAEQPAAVMAAPADPVAAFIETALRAAPGATTAFADIQAAWKSWCGRHGVRSDAINLGIALKAAGYDRTKLDKRRVGYAGVALAA